MTPQNAIQLVDQATSMLQLNRQDTQNVMIAIDVLRQMVDQNQTNQDEAALEPSQPEPSQPEAPSEPTGDTTEAPTQPSVDESGTPEDANNPDQAQDVPLPDGPLTSEVPPKPDEGDYRDENGVLTSAPVQPDATPPETDTPTEQ